MLRTRFLTVYETLSPETAREVFGIAPTELAAYPMIRVMQMLLDPGDSSRPSFASASRTLPFSERVGEPRG